ncbi:dash complex subunit duo1 [Ophiostoma piceae UAMH 11346]|uniref:DASH complex subunit DUO1 n=1 Tax=Ophiostoma piceae (strain UAMH 11346) TaxID=1262450 RepID=S3CYI3_OPHP1|nr:dash complex subunit duo1 [Ophiostoma piceae UAMH 11346]
MDSSDLFSSSPVKEPEPYYPFASRGREAGRNLDSQPHTPKTPTSPKTPTTQQTQRPGSVPPPTAFDTEEARDAALQRELDGVRQINKVIEGVIGTLEQSRGNMKTVAQTVGNASALLSTWTRLLSQTEHNQRLLLDPQWKGATNDLAELEAEEVHRQQEAERRAAEAERRAAETKRKAEEEERRRTAGTSTSTTTGRGLRGGLRGTRVSRTVYGSTRGVGTRGASTSGSTTFSGLTRSSSTRTGTSSTAGGTGTYGSARSGSNIGRGFGAARGTRGSTSGRGTR